MRRYPNTTNWKGNGMGIVLWTFAAIGAGCVGFSVLVILVAIMTARSKSRRRATLTPAERQDFDRWRASQSPASPATSKPGDPA